MTHNFANFGFVGNLSANVLPDKFHIEDGNPDEVFYISKEIFQQDKEDDKENFFYRYVIVIRDYSAFGEDMHNFGVYLYMLPLSKRIVDKLEDMGYEEGCEFSNQFACDAVGEGYGIIFLMEEDIPFDPKDQNSYAKAKLEAHEKAVIASNGISSIDTMRGFYLDKYQNRIGTTGWDMIDDWVHGKGDYTHLTFERLDKEMKEKAE